MGSGPEASHWTGACKIMETRSTGLSLSVAGSVGTDSRSMNVSFGSVPIRTAPTLTDRFQYGGVSRTHHLEPRPAVPLRIPLT